VRKCGCRCNGCINRRDVLIISSAFYVIKADALNMGSDILAYHRFCVLIEIYKTEAFCCAESDVVTIDSAF
jgi:hypothetical protein